ncbi:hypothetical protein N7494_001674 [Penicillium frequentans]|uniref:Uncharacterized protein n=1 Tax=Penicillium frequentans TaxID=3151616 RepID=A0AAD6GJG8_9EURO|nr:hypothetical protein N7494_001674 [Penicillium glabrum]
MAGCVVLLPIKGVELRIGGVGDGSKGDELGLAGLAVEVAVRLVECGPELLGWMLGKLLDISLVPDPDTPVPADELGQLLTVTVVVETGHAAHSPLARGQISVLEAAAAREEEDTSFLPPLAGGEARQELDTLVMTAVVVKSRPSKSAKSRTATIPWAPTGTVPKNTQEAANKAKQLFAYIPGMIDWDVFESEYQKKELSTSLNHGFEISPTTDWTIRQARRPTKNT